MQRSYSKNQSLLELQLFTYFVSAQIYLNYINNFDQKIQVVS